MIVTDITNIGDPQIVVFEGKYYCYATSLHRSSGFCVWVSDDLKSWGDPILCFDAEGHWGDADYWAPEVVHHNGRFIMHYAARIGHDLSNDTMYIGVAVSDSPIGPFVDVYNEPMFNLGYSTIDGSVLITEKGNYFYYSKDCTQNLINGVHTSQIYCVEMDDTLTKVIGEHRLMTTPEHDWELKSLPGNYIWNEGPNVIRWGDKYIMNYSANLYASNDYSICIAVADHPLGPWVKQPKANPVLCARDGLFGAGHNAFFYDLDGRLMTSLHVQTNPKKPGADRRVCIGEVAFREENGIIYQDIR